MALKHWGEDITVFPSLNTLVNDMNNDTRHPASRASRSGFAFGSRAFLQQDWGRPDPGSPGQAPPEQSVYHNPACMSSGLNAYRWRFRHILLKADMIARAA
jgi:hypothetical protein